MDTNSKKTRIIIADDHPLMRRGIRDVLEEISDFTIIGEAGDGAETYNLTKTLQPDILIIDIDMPKLNGLEVINLLKKERIQTKIIVLTMYDKESIFNRAMDLGVIGYVLKDAVVNEITEAIKNVQAGRYYISPLISNFLVNRELKSEKYPELIAGISKLTPTERKILKMISQNLTSKEIANELFISIKTVETHRSNICQKLGLHGTNALLRFVLENKDLL